METDGIVLFTPIKLAPKDLSRIKKAIALFIKTKKFKLDVKIDKSIMGGIKIKVGSRMIDLSMQEKLNQIQDHLINE